MSGSYVRCLAVTVMALAVFAPAALAQQPAPERSVAAQGLASVKVKPPTDRRHEAPIRAAVEAAEDKALPRAVANARANAAQLAKLAHLALGPVVAIADSPTTPYGPFPGFYGTFGPDRFCGTIRTSIFKTNTAGKRVRVGTRTRHTCRVPATVTAAVTVTFAAQ
jgi:Protein of unknown function (DUF541)